MTRRGFWAVATADGASGPASTDPTSSPGFSWGAGYQACLSRERVL